MRSFASYKTSLMLPSSRKRTRKTFLSSRGILRSVERLANHRVNRFQIWSMEYSLSNVVQWTKDTTIGIESQHQLLLTQQSRSKTKWRGRVGANRCRKTQGLVSNGAARQVLASSSSFSGHLRLSPGLYSKISLASQSQARHAARLMSQLTASVRALLSLAQARSSSCHMSRSEAARGPAQRANLTSCKQSRSYRPQSHGYRWQALSAPPRLITAVLGGRCLSFAMSYFRRRTESIALSSQTRYRKSVRKRSLWMVGAICSLLPLVALQLQCTRSRADKKVTSQHPITIRKFK